MAELSGRIADGAHVFPVRVYYEDTDFAGVVYYANYLRFIERARTEFLRELGVDQVELRNRIGVVFVVRRIEADFLAPAQFDDRLQILTDLLDCSGVRINLKQDVRKNGDMLFASAVTLACVGSTGRLVRIPTKVVEAVREYG